MTDAGGLTDVDDNRVLVTALTLSLLVKVFQGVPDDLTDAFRGHGGLLGVDAGNLAVLRVSDPHGVDVVNAEGQHVHVADGVDNGVGVQLVAKGLPGGAQLRVAGATAIGSEDGRTGETEEVVALEGPSDVGVHVAELGPVALVEDYDDVLVVDVAVLVAVDERAEFLDRRNDDVGARILKPTLEDGRRGVGVGGPLLEPVVLAHGLVVQILAVNDEDDLVDPGHHGGQLGGLERDQGLAGSGGVPDVFAGRDSAKLLVIDRGDFEAVGGLRGRALLLILKVLVASGVQVVLGVGAVGDDEQLDVLNQSGAHPVTPFICTPKTGRARREIIRADIREHDRVV